jgi:hypothetical protein
MQNSPVATKKVFSVIFGFQFWIHLVKKMCFCQHFSSHFIKMKTYEGCLAILYCRLFPNDGRKFENQTSHVYQHLNLADDRDVKRWTTSYIFNKSTNLWIYEKYSDFQTSNVTIQFIYSLSNKPWTWIPSAKNINTNSCCIQQCIVFGGSVVCGWEPTTKRKTVF